MAVSVAEGNAMIKACQHNNVKLSIGYRLQFDPYHQKIMSLSKEGVYGKVTYVNSQFGFSIGEPNQWRLNKKMAGGGALMDVGVYCIQAARYSYGQESLTAQQFNSGNDKFKEVDETITWQMEFPDGRISNSTTSYGFSVNNLLVSAEKTKATLMLAYSYSGLNGTFGNEMLDMPLVNQ
jgi:predicted dehydrogenase